MERAELPPGMLGPQLSHVAVPGTIDTEDVDAIHPEVSGKEMPHGVTGLAQW
ncbi:hypothetical protein D9M71_188710 [compost metagenome]|uniref:Uncharacterized protein n=1 Tax=Pseudomonas jinjuensis TaxID=198616 RepID=A0A1H0GIR2_9PSED|nr:hypothetical protein SAMN05216193_107208 [Pseudomonas jinjuensis]